PETVWMVSSPLSDHPETVWMVSSPLPDHPETAWMVSSPRSRGTQFSGRAWAMDVSQLFLTGRLWGTNPAKEPLITFLRLAIPPLQACLRFPPNGVYR
ncbi:MAG: hypothetical protein H0X66_08415, partial [Verrucomicrobia bacterium]|nr:hypothetical protein [Verrucomicrobiota bacterium]